MPKVDTNQVSFASGELGALLEGRVDLPRYQSGLRRCRNYIPFVQGPLQRRPGTHYVTNTKSGATKKARLIPFQFNVEQAYVLEFGDQYIRFFEDNAPIETAPSTPYEISSPYLEAELFDLKFTQSADVLYLVHENHGPRKLERRGTTSWTLTEIDFYDGPYQDLNATATTLTLSAGSGTGITVTASAVTGINGGAGFKTTDVGRLIRYNDGTNWTWLEIKTWSSTTGVTADVRGSAVTTLTSTNWRLGAFSDTTLHPEAVAFFEGRLWFGGGTEFPNRVYGSVSNDFENFAPTNATGSTLDDSAINLSLLANQVNAVRWMLDDEQGLLIGTAGGEWLLTTPVGAAAVTPTNVQLTRSTVFGSSKLQAVRAGKAVLFNQRAVRRVRELRFFDSSAGFEALDLSILAEHLTLGGFAQMDVMDAPQPIVWMARNDGTLAGITYDREQDVVGWHQHIVGGVSDANGAAAEVESIAVIESPDGERDELWLIVKRYIDGATVRHVEYMHKFWEEGDLLEDAWYLDSAVQYDGVSTSTIAGLDHLEGESVSVLADAAVQPMATVASGQITLAIAAEKVTVGLPYNSDLQTLRPDAGSAQGTSQGKMKRVHRVFARLWQSLGLLFGRDEDNLDQQVFRTSGDVDDTSPPVFSGDLELEFDGEYDRDGRVYLRQNQPYPGTILSISKQIQVNDR